MNLKKILGFGRTAGNGSESGKAEDKAACSMDKGGSEILSKECIRLGLPSTDKAEAIRHAGRLLVDGGYVEEEYIAAMLLREEDLSTYMGNGVAIPHGINEAKGKIKKTGISVLQYPEGIDFGSEKAYLVIGLAGAGKEHLTILSNLASIMGDEDIVTEIRRTRDIDYVHRLFTQSSGA